MAVPKDGLSVGADVALPSDAGVALVVLEVRIVYASAPLAAVLPHAHTLHGLWRPGGGEELDPQELPKLRVPLHPDPLVFPVCVDALQPVDGAARPKPPFDGRES